MDCLHQNMVSNLLMVKNDVNLIHDFTENVQLNLISGYNRRIEEDYDLIESPSSGQLEEKQLGIIFALLGPLLAILPTVLGFLIAGNIGDVRSYGFST